MPPGSCWQRSLSQIDGELLVIFDADFIPTQNFLTRTVGFFQDPKVALIQTPQTFYNPDPTARNLGLENILTPDEEVFYRQIQPIRDGVGGVICAGTSFVVRRSALTETGCFFTESLSEDYFTGVRLAAKGYRVLYLNEKLSAGLAAENTAVQALHAKTIQLIIAPVVLITACALIQNAILVRYAAVGQYMRSLALERLQLLRSREITDLFFLERLQEIDRQIPLLTQRHRLLQNVILIIYGSISIFLMNMFAIAFTVAIGSDVAATFTLILFLLGTGVLLTGVFLTTLEIHISHRVICYEVGRIAMLEIISE